MPAAKDKATKAATPPMSIAAAFHNAQLSFATHRKCVEALQAARAAAEDVAAWDEDYFRCVACVLRQFTRRVATRATRQLPMSPS